MSAILTETAGKRKHTVSKKIRVQ
jgi:hypothetical protein